MSALLDKFFAEAPVSLKRRFAYSCADRAVRLYAAATLRVSDFEKEAARLEGLTPLTNYETATEARDIASFIAKAAREGRSISARQADRAATNAANIAGDAAEAAISLSRDVSRIVRNISGAVASNFSGFVYNISREEEREQTAWVRKHWPAISSITKEALADLDAYIADGLLLGDDE